MTTLQCSGCAQTTHFCFCGVVVENEGAECASCVEKQREREQEHQRHIERQQRIKKLDKDTTLLIKLITENYFVRDSKVDMRAQRLKKRIDAVKAELEAEERAQRQAELDTDWATYYPAIDDEIDAEE